MSRKTAAAQALSTLLTKRAAYRNDPEELAAIDAELGPGTGRFIQDRANSLAHQLGYPTGAGNLRPLGMADHRFSRDVMNQAMPDLEEAQFVGVEQPPIPYRSIDPRDGGRGNVDNILRQMRKSVQNPLLAPAIPASLHRFNRGDMKKESTAYPLPDGTRGTKEEFEEELEAALRERGVTFAERKHAAVAPAKPSVGRAAVYGTQGAVLGGIGGAGLGAPIGGAAGLLYGLLRRRKDGESRFRNAMSGLVTGAGAGAIGGGGALALALGIPAAVGGYRHEAVR